MKTFKVALLGYYGFGNLGDELLLKACIDSLNLLGISNGQIIILSNNPEETQKNFKVQALNRWKFRDLIKAFSKSENFLLGGGGLFQDSTSSASCVYYWAVVRLAKLMGLKIFALGQSIGPLNSRASKFFTGNALKACKKIHVRDENSLRLAEDLGCKNVTLGADLVLSLTGSSCYKQPSWKVTPFCQEAAILESNPPVSELTSPLRQGGQESSSTFAIPVTPCLPCVRGGAERSEAEGLILKKGAQRAKEESSVMLINLRPFKNLEGVIKILEPHVKNFPGEKIGAALSKEDEKILKDFQKDLGLTKILMLKNFSEAEALWSSACCCVGMRLHFGVLSRIFRKPVALIPYDLKVSEFARQSGIPCITDKWQAPAMPLEISEYDKIFPWTSAELTKSE